MSKRKKIRWYKHRREIPINYKVLKTKRYTKQTTRALKKKVSMKARWTKNPTKTKGVSGRGSTEMKESKWIGKKGVNNRQPVIAQISQAKVVIQCSQ